MPALATLAALALALFGPAPAGQEKPAAWGKLVKVDGRRVHLRCEGSGPTTVVVLHGTPRFSFHYADTMARASRFARVCAYDRAGDAWSDPIAGQPTARIFVDELDRMIRHWSPSRPVILVGHSVGGVLARAYYTEHATRVSAMVLIDTAPLGTAQITAGGKRVPMIDATDDQLREAADAARKQSRAPAPPASIAPPFHRLPPAIHAAHIWATKKWQAYAASVDLFVALKYQADLYKLAAKADATSRSSSTPLPMWFLTRAQQAAGVEPWVEAQEKMAAEWPGAKLVRVAPSGHDIQLDQPEPVVQAIEDAVRAMRGY